MQLHTGKERASQRRWRQIRGKPAGCYAGGRETPHERRTGAEGLQKTCRQITGERRSAGAAMGRTAARTRKDRTEGNSIPGRMARGRTGREGSASGRPLGKKLRLAQTEETPARWPANAGAERGQHRKEREP